MNIFIHISPNFVSILEATRSCIEYHKTDLPGVAKTGMHEECECEFKTREEEEVPEVDKADRPHHMDF